MKSTLFLMLVIVVSKKGDAIRCYQCSTISTTIYSFEDDCASVGPTECGNSYNHCYETTSSSNILGITASYAVRGCSYAYQESRSCTDDTLLGIPYNDCTAYCSTDGCNYDYSPPPPTTTIHTDPFSSTRTLSNQPTPIRCYQCTHANYDFLRDCPNDSLRECSDGETRCSSTTTTNNGEHVSYLSCSSLLKSGCTEIAGVQMCYCNSDGCNRNHISSIPLLPSSTPSTSTGPGIKCYQCTYSSYSWLNDCTDDSLRECPSGSTFCNAATASTAGNTVAYRSCAYSSISGCSEAYGIETCIDICDTDGCNGGEKRNINLIVLLTTTFMVVLVFFN